MTTILIICKAVLTILLLMFVISFGDRIRIITKDLHNMVRILGLGMALGMGYIVSECIMVLW